MITIYNVLGQRVQTLVDARQDAGSHVAQWEGKNDSGSEVGSGVYIYRMVYQTPNQNKEMVQKILLLK